MLKPYYQDSAVTIYHADCREWLGGAPKCFKVDLILTDYPYGVGEQYASYNDTPEGLQKLIDSTMPLFLEHSDRILVSTGTKNIWRYPKPTWILAWYNPAGSYPGPWGFTCWHPILAYGPDPHLRDGKGSMPDAIKRTQISEKNGHPCPKPYEIWTWLLNRGSTKQSDVVLDPLMGSGTTLRAAKDLGRKAIGIEIEEKYCEIAARRMAQEVLPLAV